jgi:hypothetical protein
VSLHTIAILKEQNVCDEKFEVLAENVFENSGLLGYITPLGKYSQFTYCLPTN